VGHGETLLDVLLLISGLHGVGREQELLSGVTFSHTRDSSQNLRSHASAVNLCLLNSLHISRSVDTQKSQLPHICLDKFPKKSKLDQKGAGIAKKKIPKRDMECAGAETTDKIRFTKLGFEDQRAEVLRAQAKIRCTDNFLLHCNENIRII
jgi:hypothetical protein